MFVEIERKFLVKRELFVPQSVGVLIKQGYLSVESCLLVRVRTKEKKAFLTLKEHTLGLTRNEYEYEIPLEDGEALLKKSLFTVIEKKRYKEFYEDYCFEVDEFFGENEGLLLAEIELKREDDEFLRPQWLGQEVSLDARYYNINLAKNPYKNWEKS